MLLTSSCVAFSGECDKKKMLLGCTHTYVRTQDWIINKTFNLPVALSAGKEEYNGVESGGVEGY